MAKRAKITFNPFDADSIIDAIGQINLFSRKFDAKVDLFIRKLAEKGVEIAKDKIQTYNAVFTAELLNSVHLESRDGCYLIVSDSDHTAFVEFGTGTYGEMHPYKYPLPEGVSWQYNVGETIQYAEEPMMWGDQPISAGTYYWFYFKNGKWHLCQGMRSRPFMYETAMELHKVRLIRQVANEVFGDA